MSMIEKVARALALADLDEETRRIVDLDAHMAHVEGHYRELARAAIEAMRAMDAVPAVAGAIEEAHWDGRDFAALGRADKERYTKRLISANAAMIDAILAEGQ